MEQDRVVEELGLLPVPTEELVLSARLELGGRVSGDKLSGLISLGRPLVLPIRPEVIKNEQLSQFVDSERRSSRFVLIHIVISFRPSERLLEKVVVGLSLSHAEGSRLPPPIAWSLWPAKLSSPVKFVDKVGLTAKLGLGLPTGFASMSEEVRRTTESTKESTVEDLFVVAVGERESDPEWSFTGTTLRPLLGIQSLSTMVQIPKKVRAHAGLLVAATIRGPLGLIRYRAELPHQYAQLEL